MRLRRGAAILAAWLVVACGGGGGGDGDGGGNGGGGPGTGSGLVPDAPAPGETLAERADTLRPVVAGAQWFYQTYDHVNRMRSSFVTSATARAGGGVTEVDTDDPEAPVAVTLDETSGTVSLATTLRLAPEGAPLQLRGPELRSPVRVDDQYVLLDRADVDSGLDLDEDGRPERMAIAVYRRVIGAASVTLPNASGKLETVRVDTFVKARLTPSAGGAALTIAVRDSSWYAAGIGIVRHATRNSDDAGTLDDEAWLTGYDGVTRGWGAVVRAPQFDLPIADAVRVGDAILAQSSLDLVKIDRDGRVVGRITRAESGLPMDGGRLQATAGGLRYVVAGDPGDIRITEVDDDGRALAGHPVVHIDLAAFNDPSAYVLLEGFSAAPGGDRFWMGWLRRTTSAGTTRSELLAQGFDLNGRPVGMPIVLPTVGDIGPTVVIQATPDSGLLATWEEYDNVDGHRRAQARLDRAGAPLWNARRPIDVDTWLSTSAVFALFDGADTWLTWRSGSGRADAIAYGVRVGADGGFLGAPSDGSAFTSERLTALRGDYAFHLLAGGHTVQGGRIHATATVWRTVFPGDAADHRLEYAEFDAGAGALRTGLRQVRSVVVPELTTRPAVPPIVFDDRVLLLTQQGDMLRATLVWR